jgi:hypothetical protein
MIVLYFISVFSFYISEFDVVLERNDFYNNININIKLGGDNFYDRTLSSSGHLLKPYMVTPSQMRLKNPWQNLSFLIQKKCSYQMTFVTSILDRHEFPFVFQRHLKFRNWSRSRQFVAYRNWSRSRQFVARLHYFGFFYAPGAGRLWRPSWRTIVGLVTGLREVKIPSRDQPAQKNG